MARDSFLTVPIKGAARIALNRFCKANRLRREDIVEELIVGFLQNNGVVIESEEAPLSRDQEYSGDSVEGTQRVGPPSA